LLTDVINVPFDAMNPPDEPPEGVVQPLLWRLASRLHRDHELDQETPGLPRCGRCWQPWPCAARRLAERGLVAAFAPPETSAGREGGQPGPAADQPAESDGTEQP
jgi:hypothetical protein